MDNNDGIIEFDAAKIKRLKNLKIYKDKTDEEIIEILRDKAQRANAPKDTKKKPVDSYDKRFNEMFRKFQKEFSLDMNDSNDVEGLRTLVNLRIQLESVNRDIDAIQRQDHLTTEDYRSLKTLGDFQTGVARSIEGIEDKLGISRKLRKEKQTDDAPKFISMLLTRAKESFDAKTTIVNCPRCMIELARMWINIPDKEDEVHLALVCWKCKEKVEYLR